MVEIITVGTLLSIITVIICLPKTEKVVVGENVVKTLIQRGVLHVDGEIEKVPDKIRRFESGFHRINENPSHNLLAVNMTVEHLAKFFPPC